jgi:hypothetical protein
VCKEGHWPYLSRPDVIEDRHLRHVRAEHDTAHGGCWDIIGRRDGELGWWAVRHCGGGTEHWVVCQTLAALAREMTAIEARDT